MHHYAPSLLQVLCKYFRNKFCKGFALKWIMQTTSGHCSLCSVVFLFTTRVCLCVFLCVCVWSALHTVHILPSKSWPVFSSRADMPGLPCVHTKNGAPPHLASVVSESSADSRQDFWHEASTYLSCDDLLWPVDRQHHVDCPKNLYVHALVSEVSPYPPDFLALVLKGLFCPLHAQTV